VDSCGGKQLSLPGGQAELPCNDGTFAPLSMIQDTAQNEVFSGPLFFKKRGGFAFQERDGLQAFFPGKPPLFFKKAAVSRI